MKNEQLLRILRNGYISLSHFELSIAAWQQDHTHNGVSGVGLLQGNFDTEEAVFDCIRGENVIHT
jgi:hypothetical protein